MNELQRAMLNRAADQLDRLATAVFQRYREVAMAEAESADELCKEIRSHLMSLAAPPTRPHRNYIKTSPKTLNNAQRRPAEVRKLNEGPPARSVADRSTRGRSPGRSTTGGRD